MKFFNLFLCFASVAISTQATITRPDEVLIQLNALEANVLDYQATVQATIKKYRSFGTKTTSDYFNKTLNIIESNVQEFSASDTIIRATLANQTQSACILNLENFIDQIIELSGYAISNCIESKNISAEGSVDFAAILDQFENDVNVLAEIIVNALIGRNIFTEGEAILARVQQQLEAKTSQFNEILAVLEVKSEGVTVAWSEEIKNLKTCFKEIDSSIQFGISTVQSQLPVCIRFGGRGARSALPILPHPKNFFPQLA